jgi:hypothetical protein
LNRLDSAFGFSAERASQMLDVFRRVSRFDEKVGDATKQATIIPSKTGKKM